jgi:hypothetical protein
MGESAIPRTTDKDDPMHQPNLPEIHGELLALRCYVAAIAAVLPASVQARIAPAFVHHADLVHDQLGHDAANRFERVATALAMPPSEMTGKASPQKPQSHRPCGE